jgi:hypothetical protein
MIRLSALISSLNILILVWHECGENPGIFCYLIGKGAFQSARARELTLVPVSSESHSLATNSLTRQRTNSACSTLYSTSSAHSIIPRD